MKMTLKELKLARNKAKFTIEVCDVIKKYKGKLTMIEVASALCWMVARRIDSLHKFKFITSPSREPRKLK